MYTVVCFLLLHHWRLQSQQNGFLYLPFESPILLNLYFCLSPSPRELISWKHKKCALVDAGPNLHRVGRTHQLLVDRASSRPLGRSGIYLGDGNFDFLHIYILIRYYIEGLPGEKKGEVLWICLWAPRIIAAGRSPERQRVSPSILAKVPDDCCSGQNPDWHGHHSVADVHSIPACAH